MTRGWVCAALGLALTACAGREPRVRVDLEPSSPSYGVIEVEDLDHATIAELRRLPSDSPAWVGVLALYTDAWNPEAPDAVPAVAGRWALAGSRLSFTPRHPLVAGMSYRVRWQPPGRREPVLVSVRIPAPVLTATTEVIGVFPSSGDVPENLLKIYVQFSAPMRRGEAARHLRLRDGTGNRVETPFVAPEQELWDPASTRLTLILDPGRIKRGVGPNKALGAPLRAGEGYTLEIDREWSDGRGAPLRDGFSHRFTAGAPDHDAPSIEAWQLSAPAGGTAPLAVRFPEPLDRALLESALEVRCGEIAVEGEIAVGEGEREWRFTPREPWPSGACELRVATVLEDLAGNSLRRAFETGYDEPLALGSWARLTFRVP